MEKSQAKGIERNVIRGQDEAQVEDAWKNPKQRELKECSYERFDNQRVSDAWKNPKQRELKEEIAITRKYNLGKMHGKIPSKGN